MKPAGSGPRVGPRTHDDGGRRPVFSLREATARDAEALTALRRRCQVQTYGPLFGRQYVRSIQSAPSGAPDEQPDEYPAGQAGAEDRGHIAEPSTRVVLAHDRDGEPVGFAIAADGPADWEYGLVGDQEPCRELVSLYTVDAVHGTGLGARLLETVLDDRSPAEPVYLWVMEGNDRAVAFYRKHGFVPLEDGLPCEGAWAGQRTFRMRRG